MLWLMCFSVVCKIPELNLEHIMCAFCSFNEYVTNANTVSV